MEARFPRILAAHRARRIDRPVTGVVEVRVLDVAALRNAVADARGVAGVAVEVSCERRRAVIALAPERTVVFERAERREGKDLAVRGEPITDRPATPAEQRSHRVVRAECGRAAGDRMVGVGRVAILEVESQRAHFLADPGVQSGEVDRVRRRPVVVFVLLRRRQEEEAAAQPDLVEGDLFAEVGVGLDEAHGVAAELLRIVSCNAAGVQAEPARRMPVEAEVGEGGEVVAIAARFQPAEATLEPRRGPGRIHATRGDEAREVERLLRAQGRREEQGDEEAAHGRHYGASARNRVVESSGRRGEVLEDATAGGLVASSGIRGSLHNPTIRRP